MRLRAHHLICLLFLRRAYSEEFSRVLEEYRRRFEGGEEAEVVKGIDDICEKCPKYERGECDQREIEEYDEDALDILGVKVGGRVRYAEVAEALRRAPDSLLEYCRDCEFWEQCRGVIEEFLSGGG